jgi:hypothetical protein
MSLSQRRLVGTCSSLRSVCTKCAASGGNASQARMSGLSLIGEATKSSVS